MRNIIPGSTDQTIDVFIKDTSSNTGDGLASLAYNTSGLKCYYRRGATGSATEVPLATQTVGGTHSDGGFVEIDATNMPGVYRLDIPDAVCASGVEYVTLLLYGATDMMPTPVVITLEDRATAADVYSEFSSTSRTEKTDAPDVTDDILAKIDAIHQMCIHKIVGDGTAEKKTIYRADGVTTWLEATASKSGNVVTVGPLATP